MDKRQLLGSKTAKGGFENEDDIAEKGYVLLSVF